MNKFWFVIGVGVIFLVFLGFFTWSYIDQPVELPEEEEALPEDEVSLYFYHMDTAKLIVKKQTVPEAKSPSERVHQIVHELTNSPDTKSIVSLMPENIELRSVFFDGQMVFLDFNDELIGAAEGSSGEMLFLYSIVNSVLANLPDQYKLVQFLVQGEMRKTIGPYGEESGHIAIQYPLGPRWDLANSS